MIDTARQRLGPGADLRLADGPRLPVDDGCADLVLISLVLHSIPRTEAVALLAEAGRALAPAGRVLVTDFGTAGLRFPRGWATRGFTVVAEVLSGPTHAGDAVGYLRHGGLGPLVADAGLTIHAQRPSPAATSPWPRSERPTKQAARMATEKLPTTDSGTAPVTASVRLAAQCRTLSSSPPRRIADG